VWSGRLRPQTRSPLSVPTTRNLQGTASASTHVLAPQPCRCQAQLREHAYREQRSRASVMQDLRSAASQVAIHLHHLRDGRLVGPHEGITHFAHCPAHRSIVDVRVCAVQIAHRLCQTTLCGLEDKPLVAWVGSGPSHGQAEFERHVETWCTRSVAIELDARQVMKSNTDSFL
jgi:hypothetical protein